VCFQFIVKSSKHPIISVVFGRKLAKFVKFAKCLCLAFTENKLPILSFLLLMFYVLFNVFSFISNELLIFWLYSFLVRHLRQQSALILSPHVLFLLDATDVCDTHQNMALSFSTNQLASCNGFQMPSLPWRERAFKKGKMLRRHRDRAHRVWLASAAGVTSSSLWGIQDPEMG